MGAEGTIDVQEAILTTRAIRRFTDAPVTDDEILTCLRAAVQAPSGGNIQPWQFLVVSEPPRKRAIAALYHRAYDRYERALLGSLPPFRSADDEASFMRSVAASRHLAEHLGEVPALVLFLMFDISMTLEDEEGPLDVGTPFASVYPAVQNFMLAARGLGIGTTLTTVYPHPSRRVAGAVRDSRPLPGRRARAGGPAPGRLLRRSPPARRGGDSLGPVRQPPLMVRGPSSWSSSWWSSWSCCSPWSSSAVAAGRWSSPRPVPPPGAWC